MRNAGLRGFISSCGAEPSQVEPEAQTALAFSAEERINGRKETGRVPFVCHIRGVRRSPRTDGCAFPIISKSSGADRLRHRAIQTIKLASPVQGLVDGVNVTRGDRVRKGENWRTWNRVWSKPPSMPQEFGQRARSRPLEPGAFKFQKNKLGRHETLKDQQWISTALAEEVRRDEEMARLKVAEAELDQKLAGAELERARRMRQTLDPQPAWTALSLDRFLSPGEWYTAGAPIVRLTQIDILNVEVLRTDCLYQRFVPACRRR